MGWTVAGVVGVLFGTLQLGRLLDNEACNVATVRDRPLATGEWVARVVVPICILLGLAWWIVLHAPVHWTVGMLLECAVVFLILTATVSANRCTGALRRLPAVAAMVFFLTFCCSMVQFGAMDRNGRYTRFRGATAHALVTNYVVDGDESALLTLWMSDDCQVDIELYCKQAYYNNEDWGGENNMESIVTKAYQIVEDQNDDDGNNNNRMLEDQGNNQDQQQDNDQGNDQADNQDAATASNPYADSTYPWFGYWENNAEDLGYLSCDTAWDGWAVLSPVLYNRRTCDVDWFTVETRDHGLRRSQDDVPNALYTYGIGSIVMSLVGLAVFFLLPRERFAEDGDDKARNLMREARENRPPRRPFR